MRTDPVNGVFVRKYKYFFNLIEMPWLRLYFIASCRYCMQLYKQHFPRHGYGIWYSGIGTVLVVLSLFFLAGYNNTPYYPSAVDLQSSLTIYNSSSSLFTLEVMTVVSFLVPFVLAYIVYAWRAMDKKPITEQEMESGEHTY
ncbi:MAG: cytochrome d ubiquinol oxidase subunit II [Coprobacter sp.]